MTNDMVSQHKAKKKYEVPLAEVVTIRAHSQLLAGSQKAQSGGSLGGWKDEGEHAWDEPSPSAGGGSNMGGWTDNGDDAWQ